MTSKSCFAIAAAAAVHFASASFAPGEEPVVEAGKVHGTVAVFDAGYAGSKFPPGTTFTRYIDNVKRNKPKNRTQEEWNRHCDGVAADIAGCRVLFVDVVKTSIEDGEVVTRFVKGAKPSPILILMTNPNRNNAPAAANALPPRKYRAEVLQVLDEGPVRKIDLSVSADIAVDDENTNRASYPAIFQINAEEGQKAFEMKP